ncbi:MAG: hypothetical protein H0U75_02395 [Legionella sp.]|nr:hypothetical protein [Legionella sp.]
MPVSFDNRDYFNSPPLEGETFYEILGVPETSDARSIALAYKDLMSKYRTNINAEQLEQSKDLVLKFHESYNCLMGEHSRQIYDQRLYKEKTTREFENILLRTKALGSSESQSDSLHNILDSIMAVNDDGSCIKPNLLDELHNKINTPDDWIQMYELYRVTYLLQLKYRRREYCEKAAALGHLPAMMEMIQAIQRSEYKPFPSVIWAEVCIQFIETIWLPKWMKEQLATDKTLQSLQFFLGIAKEGKHYPPEGSILYDFTIPLEVFNNLHPGFLQASFPNLLKEHIHEFKRDEHASLESCSPKGLGLIATSDTNPPGLINTEGAKKNHDPAVSVLSDQTAINIKMVPEDKSIPPATKHGYKGMDCGLEPTNNQNKETITSLINLYTKYQKSLSDSHTFPKSFFLESADTKKQLIRTLLQKLHGLDSLNQSCDKTDEEKINDFYNTFKDEDAHTILSRDRSNLGYKVLKYTIALLTGVIPYSIYLCSSYSKTEGNNLVNCTRQLLK